MTTEYNGWTNWETWNTNLWIDNEYNDYMAKVALLKRAHTINADVVKCFVYSIYPKGTPDFDDVSDFNAVNWQEIAEHWQIEQSEYE